MAEYDRETILNKYGPDQGAIIWAGLQAVERRRAEYRFNHPDAFTLPEPKPEPEPKPKPEPAALPLMVRVWPEHGKLWPLVGFAAIRGKHGGAWRVWSLAQVLDQDGGGKVYKPALLGCLYYLGVHERNRRRWISDALQLGIMREGGSYFYLAGLGVAAVKLGGKNIHKPAIVNLRDLFSKGWRSLVWSAYLVTLGPDAVISQNTKAAITGIDPRTQRNYQARQPGRAKSNYVDRGKAIDSNHGDVLRAAHGLAYFVNAAGRLTQRLPDGREVPDDVARPAPKGRSKKAQKLVNFSLPGEREHDKFYRLFYQSHDKLLAALRRMAYDDGPRILFELFEVVSKRGRSARWAGVTI